MMRIPLSIILILFCTKVLGAEGKSTDLITSYQVSSFVDMFAKDVDRKFQQIFNLFPSVQRLLDSEPDDRAIFQAMGTIVGGVRHARSLLLIDNVGLLRFHSSEYPAPMLELSDRAYFRKSMIAETVTPVIDELLINRVSQQPFVPVSTRLTKGGNRWVGVVDVNPDALIDQRFQCATCRAWILTLEGKVISSTPAGLPPPLSIVNTIISKKEKFYNKANAGLIQVIFDLRRLSSVDLVVVFSLPPQ